jgi:hypothetical protein
MTLEEVMDMIDALPEAPKALNGVEADRLVYVEARDKALHAVGWTLESYEQALCDAIDRKAKARAGRKDL